MNLIDVYEFLDRVRKQIRYVERVSFEIGARADALSAYLETQGLIIMTRLKVGGRDFTFVRSYSLYEMRKAVDQPGANALSSLDRLSGLYIEQLRSQMRIKHEVDVTPRESDPDRLPA